MDKYLGKRLEGRYEIAEIIGIGGMANVYRAWDVIEERTVAVKILRDEYLNNEEFLRRFRNESKAISVLSHPNIVKVYDVCFSEKMQSIVMEYVDGITLKEYIDQQKVLRWKDAVHFAVQILRALQHAHEKGIVHRDIKPQNIMLLSDGTIKVTDFGIARFSRSETRTLTDKAIGSVHYISPEQASGETTDEKSDLYSVGVMLYEMLTGRLPFEADSPVSVALKQIQSQARRPRELNPSIPEGLEAITMRAMQKNPQRRYQSAVEMLRDIDEFKQNPSIHFAYKYLDAEEERMEQKRVNEAIRDTRSRKQQHPPRRRKQSVPYVAVLTGITAAFVVVTIAFMGVMLYLNNPFVSVEEMKAPSLLGIRYDQLQNDPRFDDVQIVYDGEVNNDEYAKGQICSQKPEGGKNIKIGGTITVKVSAGPAVVELVDFTGQEETMVYSKLTDMGLTYTTLQEYSEIYAEHYVMRTDPAPGEHLRSGSNVTVVVSMGPEIKSIPVPDVTGKPIEEVEMVLASMNLVVGNVSYQSSSLPDGTVIAQDPMGVEVEEGTEINLVVSGSRNTSVSKLTVRANLPEYDGETTIESVIDGMTSKFETINPAELGTWQETVKKKGSGVLEYELYLNGYLFQRYELDFETGAIHKELDNSHAVRFE